MEYWLCADCTQAAINDDFTGLDYYLSPKRAEQRMRVIQEGLKELGHIATDFTDDLELECADCGYRNTEDAWTFTKDEYDELVPVCRCGSLEVGERGSGTDEYSNSSCDCCGTLTMGVRFRFTSGDQSK